METLPDQQRGQRAVTVLGYLMLFLLGVFQGLLGSFQFSRSPAPVIAIIFIVVIFVTCVAFAWGLGTVTGALLPAVGWFLASFILSMPRPNGSVVITNTAAGQWYLYGGALACLIGCFTAFILRVTRSARPR